MVEVVDPQEGLHLAAILDLLLAHSAGHFPWVAVHTSHQRMSIGLVLGAVVMVLHKHHCHWRQTKCASARLWVQAAMFGQESFRHNSNSALQQRQQQSLDKVWDNSSGSKSGQVKVWDNSSGSNSKFAAIVCRCQVIQRPLWDFPVSSSTSVLITWQVLTHKFKFSWIICALQWYVRQHWSVFFSIVLSSLYDYPNWQHQSHHFIQHLGCLNVEKCACNFKRK